MDASLTVRMLRPPTLAIPLIPYPPRFPGQSSVGIAEARDRGEVGNPRGLTMNVVPRPREGLVRPDPGWTPGRPAAV